MFTSPLSTSQCFIYVLLLLLLLSRPPGIVPFIIKVPTDYTALQGQLVVHIIFPKEPEDSVAESGSRETNVIYDGSVNLNDSVNASQEIPAESITESPNRIAESYMSRLESFVNPDKSISNQIESFSLATKIFNNKESFPRISESVSDTKKSSKNHDEAFFDFNNSDESTMNQNLLTESNLLAHRESDMTGDKTLKIYQDSLLIPKKSHMNPISRNLIPEKLRRNCNSNNSNEITDSIVYDSTYGGSFTYSNIKTWRNERSIPSPSSPSSAMLLFLYAEHLKKPLKRFKVPEDGTETWFTFPCGLVVHGGIHFLRLKRNRTVLAESAKFNVSWPIMVIHIPIRLETYRSPADTQFSFIKAHACPSGRPNAFKTWAELLYHGPENTRSTRTRFPAALRQDENEAGDGSGRNKRTLVEKSVHNKVLLRTKKRTFKNSEIVSKIVTKDIDISNTGKSVLFSDTSGNNTYISNQESDSALNLLNTNARKSNYSMYYAPSTSRPKRMYTLTSLQGSTIPSRSNTNFKPEALKVWPWDQRSGVQIVQRVPLLGDLYSQGKYDVRFSCEVVGPAGRYSVRIVTDVPSSPVVAQSDTFQVDWAEEFTIHVPRINLIPCNGPVPVAYTRPLCVGKQEKIRLFASIKAHVASANPPIHERYITERRASNRSTSFDCDYFTDEPTDYCFVYVNTATSGAVSDVRRQCVPTFKPGVLRRDGQWGNWSSWTDCTTTCGSGVKIRHRFCNNPPPRNGGLFCQGSPLATELCGNTSCILTRGPNPIPSSALPPFGEENECSCGCHVALAEDADIVISSSAADCVGTSTWIFESPPGTVISGDLLRAALLPGLQWLKIRDGNDSLSPLLLSLPSFRLMASDAVPERVTSSQPLLFVSFLSDMNSTFVGNVWGFRMRIKTTAPFTHFVWSVMEVAVKKPIAPFHIVVMVLGSCILIAMAGYLAYYCRQYPKYRKSRLVLSDSPLYTPEASPTRESRPRDLAAAASVTTLTEVLSLKSLRFGVRKSSSSSYTRLAKEGDFKKGILRSLPVSPVISLGRLPPYIRRSSTQLSRLLKKGNSQWKKQNRRSASFDQLRSNVSPIYEDVPLTGSLTMENLGNRKDSEEKIIFIEKELKVGDEEGKGGENSNKYKEHRKSLLASNRIIKNLQKDLNTSKLSKDKLNQEKANRERVKRETISSSSEGTVRPASSVSQLSMNSGCMEMEYDYYDYDVGNASAVPGSLLGMDPTLIPWGMIDIEDLDIKDPEELANDERSNSVNFDRSGLITPPSKNSNVPLEEIQLERLNILPTSSHLLQTSSLSNDSNESLDKDRIDSSRTVGFESTLYTDETNQLDDDDDDLTPRAEVKNFPENTKDESDVQFRNSSMPTGKSDTTKVLNIHDVDDFQFADESEDEDVIYS